jgi:transcriptional regulator with XRE-family HTH domain
MVEVTADAADPLPQNVALSKIRAMGMLEKILRAGRARGLSQLEIERRANLAGNRISKIRKDEDRLRWGEVREMAAVVGVSLDWLASDAPDDLPCEDHDLAWITTAIRDLGPAEARRRLLGVPGPAQPPDLSPLPARNLSAGRNAGANEKSGAER